MACQSSLCFSGPTAQTDKEIRRSWKIFLCLSLSLSLSLWHAWGDRSRENVTGCHFYNLIYTLSEIYLRLTSWWSQEAVQEPLEVKQIIVHILPTISFNTPLEVQAGRKWNFNIGHPPTKHTLGFLIVKWFIKEYTVESKHPHWPFFFLFKVLLVDAWNVYIHILYGSVVPFKMCKRKLSNDVPPCFMVPRFSQLFFLMEKQQLIMISSCEYPSLSELFDY